MTDLNSWAHQKLHSSLNSDQLSLKMAYPHTSGVFGKQLCIKPYHCMAWAKYFWITAPISLWRTQTSVQWESSWKGGLSYWWAPLLQRCDVPRLCVSPLERVDEASRHLTAVVLFLRVMWSIVDLEVTQSPLIRVVLVQFIIHLTLNSIRYS